VGRPITDQSSSLIYPELADDVREVLRTLVFTEREVATRDGRWFKVRVMPYRSLENMIDGVVVTFTDITVSRILETKLRESLALYQAPFESIAEGVIVQASGGEVTFANTAAERILGVSRDRIREHSLADPLLQAVHEDGSSFSAEGLPAAVALTAARPIENVVLGILNPYSQQRVWISMNATPVVLPGEEKPSRVYMIFRDITEGREARGTDGRAKDAGQ
jgi:two-component system, chemotaxis family, CheB/CheR fusion protein